MIPVISVETIMHLLITLSIASAFGVMWLRQAFREASKDKAELTERCKAQEAYIGSLHDEVSDLNKKLDRATNRPPRAK